MQTLNKPLAEQLLDIASRTGVFNAIEIDILKEVIASCEAAPDQHYFLRTEQDQEKIAGFVIFGRTPLTQSTWDIYWLAVDPMIHKKGIGQKLMAKVQTEVLTHSPRGVIRIETSSRSEYAGARRLYAKCGFRQVGLIDNFYQDGDSLHIFTKHL